MKIDYQILNPDTLRNLVVHFIAREGTDYGAKEHTLDEKVAQVMAQLKNGEATIVFDPESETCDIADAQRLRFLQKP